MHPWNLKPQKHPPKQSLRLTPYAWAKLLFLRDAGPTEVGAFGVSARQDLLLVHDVHLIKQRTTAVTVAFEDEAVADYLDSQVDQGLTLEQCMRCWIHTHPGDSALPSSIDEATFSRCFSMTDWAVMLILAQGGQTYARLRFRAGPGGELELPVSIAWDEEFWGSQLHYWQRQYDRLVKPVDPFNDQTLMFLGNNESSFTGPYQSSDDWGWEELAPADWASLEFEDVYP